MMILSERNLPPQNLVCHKFLDVQYYCTTTLILLHVAKFIIENLWHLKSTRLLFLANYRIRYVRERRFVVEINFSYALILNSRGYHRDHFPPTVHAPFNAQLFPLWLYLIVRASIPNQLFICLTFIILCLILILTRVLNSFLYIQWIVIFFLLFLCIWKQYYLFSITII